MRTEYLNITNKLGVATKESGRARELLKEKDGYVASLQEDLQLALSELSSLKAHVREVIKESLSTPERRGLKNMADLCENDSFFGDSQLGEDEEDDAFWTLSSSEDES